jgi:4-amino-4-deoxy-L-arabinose transferase-like glycosyltransferase
MGTLGQSPRRIWHPSLSVPRISDASILVALLTLAGSVLRIVLAGSVGFGTDESYTVANARHLAWSYVDYPPLHVWLTWAAANLGGSEAPIFLRLPFIALFAASTWQMFRLTAFLFGEAAGVWSAVLFNLAPVFTLAHASWVLPDGPLAFFMLSGALVVAHLLFGEGRSSRSVSGWIAAGALTGLAMLTKYHGVFLFAGTFAYLLSTREGRTLLSYPAPWLGALVAVVLFSPVVLWNSGHDGAGLYFQTNRLTSASHLNFSRVLSAIIEQSLYLTPWIFLPLVASLTAALKNGPFVPRTWFLALLASGPIFVFTAVNAVVHGLPHWPMPGWLFTFPLLGAQAARLALLRPKLLRVASTFAAGVLLSLAAVAGSEARTGWIVDRLPAQDRHLDPTLDLVDWTELDSIIAERHLIDHKTAAVAALNWFEAGKLNYAIGKSIPVLCLCADPQEFRFLQDPGAFTGKNILIVGTPKYALNPELAALFLRTERVATVVLHRASRPAIELILIRGTTFRPTATAAKYRLRSPLD